MAASSLAAADILKELGEGRYLSLFTELVKANRAVKIDTRSVDDRESELRAKVRDEAFDDPHILALVGVSRCCLVCTDDVRMLPYLKRKDLYPPGVKVPRTYRSLADRKHCCTKTMVEVCPPRASAPTQRRKKAKSRPKLDTDDLTRYGF